MQISVCCITVSHFMALDPKLMIEKLKKENAQLREELALATGGVSVAYGLMRVHKHMQNADRGPLDATEIAKLRDMVRNFVASKDPNASIGERDADMHAMIHVCQCWATSGRLPRRFPS